MQPLGCAKLGRWIGYIEIETFSYSLLFICSLYLLVFSFTPALFFYLVFFVFVFVPPPAPLVLLCNYFLFDSSDNMISFFFPFNQSFCVKGK